MMDSTIRPPLLALAAAAFSRTARSHWLFAILYLAHLGVASLGWIWTSQALGPVMQNRPAPDLFAWMALAQQDSGVMFQLTAAGSIVLALQFVVGALAAALVLTRFAELGVGHALKRPFLCIILLRLLVLALAAAMLVGLWFTVAPLSGRFHEQDNELLIMGLHLLVAIPFLLPLLFMFCVAHYAQAVMVRHRLGFFRALAEGLRLVHERPGAALGLWLSGWIAWIAVAAALTLPGLESVVLAQVAVAMRVVIHLWMYAAAWEVTKLSTVDCRLSTIST